MTASKHAQAQELAHSDIRSDESDFGPGVTWCEKCGAVYGTVDWSKGCVLENNDPRYAISAGRSKGKLWIEHESGEGGDFDADGVLEAIRHNKLHDFYTRNF